MGNHKFRLSNMIPNAWFFKLKEMGNRGSPNSRARTTTKQSYSMKREKNRVHQEEFSSPISTPPKPQKSQTYLPNRASYYISTKLDLETKKFLSSPTLKSSDTHFPPLDPPRKSKRRTRRRSIKPISTTKHVTGCGCRVRKPEPESEPELETNSSWTQCSCTCRVTTSPTDIIIDVGSTDSSITKNLPPIITKTRNFEERTKTPARKSISQPVHRIKTRVSSPRVASRKSKQRKSNAKNGILDGFAVVKSSSDPQKDFRESMVEMIVENNIKTSKDLEELLACYLTLNSTEYHDVIVRVFEQIWFDLTNLRL